MNILQNYVERFNKYDEEIYKNDIDNALKSLKILYNLTRDEQIKDIILKYEPSAELTRPDGTPLEKDKPNITRTVNNNPEN